MRTELFERDRNAQSHPVGQVVVGVLGAVHTHVDGAEMAIPGGRARALLVALALEPGRRRSVAALVEEVWPEEPPRAPKNALQTQVSRLRSVLPLGSIESGPGGYRLALGGDDVDLTRAEEHARRATAAVGAHDYATALDHVLGARALWRGEPGSDLPEGAVSDALRHRADAATATLDRVEMSALVGLGEYERGLNAARRVASADPLDERCIGVVMRCLHGLGRTNEALAAYAQLREGLAERLGTDPSAELVELNAVLLAPAADKVPTTIGLRASPNALIGRDRDIAAIETLMTRSRVTTVLGPGGSGKTRTAHELGLRASAHMPVAVIELASLRRGQDVAAAISGALGLSEVDLKLGGIGVARVQTAGQRLREALSARPALLVLDNCEHVVDDVAQIVDELVSASDSLTVLTTSRSPLSITAEVTYPLPPLALGGVDSAASELFVARATAVRPGVVFEPEEVRRLCSTLDGLPLAIELAAARVRTLTVADINARLEHRFALLRSTDRTRPERHRTLHAVIDWSWNLLSEDQQRTLSRLCRFPAGFTIDAAERVAGFDGVDDVADALDGLVGQSLLAVVDEDGHVRYHMLETVREFGEERLSASDEFEVMARMFAWGADLSERAGVDYHAGRQIDAIRTIEADHDNLLDVLRRGVEAKSWPHVYAIFGVLAYFWSIRGAHTEVSNWATRLGSAPFEGEALRDVRPDHLVLAHTVVLAHSWYNSDVREAARLRSRLRRTVARAGSVDAGLKFVAQILVSRSDGKGLGRVLAVGVRSSQEPVRITALMARASLYENMGYLHGAARDAEAARSIALRRGDLWSAASSAQALGSTYGQSGRFADAIGDYTQAADLLWELHSYDESMQVRGFVGSAMIAAGRISEGRAVLARTIEMGSGVDSAIPTDADHADQRLASVTAALAEADLAEGAVDGGLSRFRHAVDVSGFARERSGDPHLTMLASASVSAHALYGVTEGMGEAVRLLESVAAVRLGPSGFRDLPQIGAVACAIGSYDIQSGHDPERGIRLLCASVTVRARQDYPSMAPARHLDAARRLLGGEAVDAALAERKNATRAGALDEIFELLRP